MQVNQKGIQVEIAGVREQMKNEVQNLEARLRE
jgi:hypothetical protein